MSTDGRKQDFRHAVHGRLFRIWEADLRYACARSGFPYALLMACVHEARIVRNLQTLKEREKDAATNVELAFQLAKEEQHLQQRHAEVHERIDALQRELKGEVLDDSDDSTDEW